MYYSHSCKHFYWHPNVVATKVEMARHNSRKQQSGAGQAFKKENAGIARYKVDTSRQFLRDKDCCCALLLYEPFASLERFFTSFIFTMVGDASCGRYKVGIFEE